MKSALCILSALSGLASVTAVPLNFPMLNLKPLFPGTPTPAACDLSQASMPAFPPAATPLSGPAAGLYLYHVAIGRGTQNYTCANETAVPTSIGAKATLYNASCIAASYPTVLSSLPSAALQVPSGDIPDSLLVSGHHYFSNATTPTFDLGSFGFSHFKKVGTENATAGSNPGVAGQAYGAVAWLKLEHETQGAVGDLMEVYRLNTAGGSPPPTCAGMPAAFEIQYSAEYWFWAGTES